MEMTEEDHNKYLIWDFTRVLRKLKMVDPHGESILDGGLIDYFWDGEEDG